MSGSSPKNGRDALRGTLLQAIEAKFDSIVAQARPDGRFGTDPWIVRDQDAMLTLTLLYQCEDGPKYRDPALLALIAGAGRYLRERQDEKGMHPFDKKDGSNWGPIFMPWTYLRWIITLDLIAKDLAPVDLAIWEEGLLLGYRGIAKTELSSLSHIYPGPLTGHPPLQPGEVIPWIHNIPCHHATGLFIAGKIFNRPEWQRQARDFMQLVVAAQSPHGWWTEHSGPVVLYNRVYVEALGLYFAFSGDDAVLPAIARGNRFQLNYTYPNGAMIETVDERNPYPPLTLKRAADGTNHYLPRDVNMHPGLFFSDEGRALLAHQLPIFATRDIAEIDSAELMLVCLPKNDAGLAFTTMPEPRFRMGNNALVAREDPWLLSFSAYCCPRTPNRFIQDRQNFVSIYHREAGLILGGGNTKLQPLWSTLTIGDPHAITPVGARRDTNLAPDATVTYTPDACTITETAPNHWVQQITAASAVAELVFEIARNSTLQISARLVQPSPDGRPATVHLTFIPYPGSPVIFPDGTSTGVTAASWEKTGLTGVSHHRWRLSLPVNATLRWPVLPHNAYKPDGRAQAEEGRLVISLPLSETAHQLTLSIRP